MDQPAMAVGLVIHPLAFVLSPVSPQLDPMAFSESYLVPLPEIYDPVLQHRWSFADEVFQFTLFGANVGPKLLFCQLGLFI